MYGIPFDRTLLRMTLARRCVHLLSANHSPDVEWWYLRELMWALLICLASAYAAAIILTKRRSPNPRLYGLLASLLSVMAILAGFSIGSFLVPGAVLILVAGFVSFRSARPYRGCVRES